MDSCLWQFWSAPALISPPVNTKIYWCMGDYSDRWSGDSLDACSCFSAITISEICTFSVYLQKPADLINAISYIIECPEMLE